MSNAAHHVIISRERGTRLRNRRPCPLRVHGGIAMEGAKAPHQTATGL